MGADPNLYDSLGSAFGCIPIVILAGDFMQLPAIEGRSRKVSVLDDLKAPDEDPSRGTKSRRSQKEPTPEYELELRAGRRIFKHCVTDVHVLHTTFRFRDSFTKIPCPYLPNILAYMRDLRGELMPYELWNALSKRVVTGPDDERLKDPAFVSGYELASQWEAAARLLQYRARREARKARQMLLYVQAIDKCTNGGSLSRADYRKALSFVNYCAAGNRAGMLPLVKGMRVRLTEKRNAEKVLVIEKAGTVTGFQVGEREFSDGAGDWRFDEDDVAWRRGYACLKYMPQAVHVRFDGRTDDLGFGPGVVAVSLSEAQKDFEVHLHRPGSESTSEVSSVPVPLAPRKGAHSADGARDEHGSSDSLAVKGFMYQP